jgi:hypothetical protein
MKRQNGMSSTYDSAKWIIQKNVFCSGICCASQCNPSIGCISNACRIPQKDEELTALFDLQTNSRPRVHDQAPPPNGRKFYKPGANLRSITIFKNSQIGLQCTGWHCIIPLFIIWTIKQDIFLDRLMTKPRDLGCILEPMHVHFSLVLGHDYLSVDGGHLTEQRQLPEN